MSDFQPVPDPSEINATTSHAIVGTSYKGISQTVKAVRAMRGTSGIKVDVTESAILIGLSGGENITGTNGQTLVWKVQPLNVCVNNNSTTIFVLAGVALENI